MSEMIKLTFPDGNVKEFEKGTSTLDVAGSISPGLKKSALAGKIDGTLIDAKTPIEADAAIEIITNKSPEALEILNKTHILAILFQNAI